MNGPDLVAVLGEEGGGQVGAILRDISHPRLEAMMLSADEELNSEGVGVDAFLDLLRDWTGTFERFEMEQKQEPVGDGDNVVNTVRQRGWLEGSDAPIEAEGNAAWFFRDGRLARIELHLSREAALRSAGIDA